MVNIRKEIGVDWLTVTGVSDMLDDVAGLLDSWCPRSEWVALGPGGSYRQRFKLPIGVRLEVDRSESGRYRVDVPGGACATLGSDRVHALGQKAGMGGTFTRLDLRMDLRGDSVRLVDDVSESCRAGQLRMLRRFQLFPIFNADGVRMEGDGVVLGSYGADRFVRVYDKGLETQTESRGRWVRWETQLREEFAHKAGCDVFASEPSDLSLTALPHAFDLVDFRIGPRDHEPKRLPRPAWWSDLIAGVGDAETGREPRSVDLDRWCEAFWHQYGGVLAAIAHDSKASVGDVAAWVLAGRKPNAGTWKNPVVGFGSAAFLRSRGSR